ncbi:helix-turn-helix domain-containing protein [Limosilactobacillus caecicola]|uniref:helix-turn-helix domain-containing protein n=1 Tax=Limosilactobacillus caecicola TaxID=2941332 RepID=UPI0020400F62|nr:helix-turn-helix transcriptional regulator [Limosilactobacillus caecicola]
MTDVTNIGETIAKVRRKRKMTQEQLAEQSEITVNYLSKIERGAAQNFSAINLINIAQALQISIDQLVSGSIERIDSNQEPTPNITELNFLLSKFDNHHREAIAGSIVKAIK